MHPAKLLLLSIFITLFFTSEKSEKTVGENYADDFGALVTTLKELHPILYVNSGKEEFDREVKTISERLLHTTSKYKAIYMIEELMFNIGSAHAGNLSVYSIGNDSAITKVLPFSVYIIDKQLYIKNYPDNPTYNGAKVFSIDNTDSKSLVDSLKIFFSVDGHRDVVDFYLQPYFNALYAAFCNQKDVFAIKTDKGDLQVKAAVRGSKVFEEMVLKTDDAYLGKNRIQKREVTNDYAYYQFSGFVRKYKQYKLEDDFYALMKEVKEKNIQNLIIDLRYNEGGDPQMGADMIRHLIDKPFRIFENEFTSLCNKPTFIDWISNPFYFKVRNVKSKKEDSLRQIVRLDPELKWVDPKNDRFNGKIYIITGSITKSASTMFCKWLVGQPNVTFVGEETSGAINYFWAGGPKGTFVKFNLPHVQTVFAFGIELLELKAGSSKTEVPVGLVPDQKIQYTIQDRLAGKDLEMDWIKSNIAKRN